MAVLKSLIALLAVLASIGASVFPASAQEVIVDATGKTVGTLHGTPQNSWVRIRMPDGNWSAFEVGMGGFIAARVAAAVYVATTNNCSGTKYFVTSLLNPGYIFKPKYPGTKTYVAYAIPPIKKISVKSVYWFDVDFGTYECYVLNAAEVYSAYAGLQKMIDLAALKLVPPFSVK